MTFDPDKHHRRSVRLRGYDYAQEGAYFVTVCLQGRACLLGDIDREMKLNDAGCMVERWWCELNHKFPTVETDACIVMPNHFHGVLFIVSTGRGDPMWSPSSTAGHEDGHPPKGAPTLGDVMGWLKTMTTNEYIRGVKQHGWPPFQGRLWQRNYHEHVIRDERELTRIREYVASNPARWAMDPENPAASSFGEERRENARDVSGPFRRGDPMWSPSSASAAASDPASRYQGARREEGHPRRGAPTKYVDSLPASRGVQRPWDEQ